MRFTGGWVPVAVFLAVAAWLGVPAARADAPTVDPGVPAYSPAQGISGSLNGTGSDTMVNLMNYWAEGYKKLYPNVKLQVEGKGSATAPPALANSLAQLGPMSREMKPEEEETIEKSQGVKPLKISTAIDCLAVYVHKDNPIRGFTLAQLDCIFSKTRKSGYADIAAWGQVGLTGRWDSLPMSIYGRNSASGTYVYFKEHVLKKGDYKDSVKEQPGSSAVVNGVANDKAGIGYSGIGYKTSEVRAVPLAKDGKSGLAEPSFANALNGKYPLGRALYIYVVKKPNEPLPPAVKEFLKYVLSQEGQQVVIKDGFGPLPLAIVQQELKKLD
jgi:phosphate transport system substrate-binding protein